MAALREAGAVIVGKTVTTEFANRHPGPTANPVNPDYSPGGSSSGSAAAVADFMVPLAIGTGVGAELRQPLAIAIIGGLIFSQMLTLFTTPVVYLTFDKLRLRIAGKHHDDFHATTDGLLPSTSE